MNDPSLLSRIDASRYPTLDNADKVKQFMRQYKGT